MKYYLNQTIQTPNGSGIVLGRMYDNGVEYVIVRHTLAKMAGQDYGHNLTPTARISGLWSYEMAEIGKNVASIE